MAIGADRIKKVVNDWAESYADEVDQKVREHLSNYADDIATAMKDAAEKIAQDVIDEMAEDGLSPSDAKKAFKRSMNAFYKQAVEGAQID